MKRLWLGLGPDIFDTKNDILSGPWCLNGKEDLYPDLNNIEFIDDPISSFDELKNAERITRDFSEYYIPILGKKLNKINNIDHGAEFWRIILMPWLLTLVQIVWLKQKLINDFIKLNKNNEISVELIHNKMKWNFKDNYDFMLNGVHNIEFSHWLFSRIMENKTPNNWQKTYRTGVQKKHTQQKT